MLDYRRNKGITMVSVVILVVVIIVLAGISLQQGKELIKTTNIEDYLTNMITIKAKAKVYAEEVNSQIWDVDDKATKRKELYASAEYCMDKVDNIESKIITQLDNTIIEGGYECYKITKETLAQMGLQEIAERTNEGDYVVIYNADDCTKLDVIYVPGIQYNEEIYYTLSRLQEAME